MALVDAKKNGHLPFLAKWIVLPLYYTLGSAARLWSLVLFLTPLLGLFDTLKLAQYARYPASNETLSDLPLYVPYNESLFVTLRDEWEPFQLADMSEMFMTGGALAAHVGVLAAAILAHLIVGGLVAGLLGFGSFSDVLHSFVCPPLFLDWEHVHR